jgi:hypothetical protein
VLSSSSSDFETFYYEKLNLSKTSLLAYSPSNLNMILIPSMNKNNGRLTYYIGNEFRVSVLLVDNQTARCLLPSDYNPFTTIQVTIQQFNPKTNESSQVSIGVPFISLV